MGQLLSSPISASFSLGGFKTDPSNARFSIDDGYNDNAYITRDWLSQKMNPFVGKVESLLRQNGEDINYNHQSAIAIGSALGLVLLIVMYWGFRLFKVKWAKRGKREINIPFEIHHENGNNPVVIRNNRQNQNVQQV